MVFKQSWFGTAEQWGTAFWSLVSVVILWSVLRFLGVIDDLNLSLKNITIWSIIIIISITAQFRYVRSWRHERAKRLEDRRHERAKRLEDMRKRLDHLAGKEYLNVREREFLIEYMFINEGLWKTRSHLTNDRELKESLKDHLYEMSCFVNSWPCFVKIRKDKIRKIAFEHIDQMK